MSGLPGAFLGGPRLPPPIPEGLCVHAKDVRLFPAWHVSTARRRGRMLYPAQSFAVRPDPREELRKYELYGERGGRSPLLARDTWALEVRVYGDRPVFKGERV